MWQKWQKRHKIGKFMPLMPFMPVQIFIEGKFGHLQRRVGVNRQYMRRYTRGQQTVP